MTAQAMGITTRQSGLVDSHKVNTVYGKLGATTNSDGDEMKGGRGTSAVSYDEGDYDG